MQVIRKIIVTSILIFLTILLYGADFLKSELPLLFCVCFAIHNRSFWEITAVSVIMGIIICTYGSYGFLHSILMCVYMSYIFFIFVPEKRPFFKKTVLFFVSASIALRSVAVYNTILFVIIYFFCKKIYADKEKFIFLQV